MVAPDTVAVLSEARSAGILLALVTGRMLESIFEIFAPIRLFDLVVAENGAVVYFPASEQIEVLGDPPSPQFVAAFVQRNIPFYTGRVVVGMKRMYEQPVQEVLRSSSGQRHAIFNVNDIMILPPGINKATGLRAGLSQFDVTSDDIAGIGDAENDIELFQACGLRVAVGNALDMLKAEADLVLDQPNGAGVAAFIREQVLQSP